MDSKNVIEFNDMEYELLAWCIGWGKNKFNYNGFWSLILRPMHINSFSVVSYKEGDELNNNTIDDLVKRGFLKSNGYTPLYGENFSITSEGESAILNYMEYLVLESNKSYGFKEEYYDFEKAFYQVVTSQNIEVNEIDFIEFANHFRFKISLDKDSFDSLHVLDSAIDSSKMKDSVLYMQLDLTYAFYAATGKDFEKHLLNQIIREALISLK